MKLISKLFYIDKSPIHGWGLFSSSTLQQDTIILQTPGVLITDHCPSELTKYTYPLHASNGLLLFLGYSSWINSSKNYNCIHYVDELNKIITIKTIKQIAPNKEITLQYFT
jgi:SET domain-containing protein